MTKVKDIVVAHIDVRGYLSTGGYRMTMSPDAAAEMFDVQVAEVYRHLDTTVALKGLAIISDGNLHKDQYTNLDMTYTMYDAHGVVAEKRRKVGHTSSEMRVILDQPYLQLPLGYELTPMGDDYIRRSVPLYADRDICMPRSTYCIKCDIVGRPTRTLSSISSDFMDGPTKLSSGCIRCKISASEPSISAVNSDFILNGELDIDTTTRDQQRDYALLINKICLFDEHQMDTCTVDDTSVIMPGVQLVHYDGSLRIFDSVAHGLLNDCPEAVKLDGSCTLRSYTKAYNAYISSFVSVNYHPHLHWETQGVDRRNIDEKIDMIASLIDRG